MERSQRIRLPAVLGAIAGLVLLAGAWGGKPPDSAPGWRPDASARVRDLRSELERLIESPRWRSDEWSVMVVSLDAGDTLFDHSPMQPLAPASNLKLFTSAAAFYYLGPAYRYQTYVIADGPIRDGMLDGDLVLYGTGDPTISNRLFPSKTTVWEELADSLRALGVREVSGDVVGDASYFSGLPVGVGWKLDYINTWYAAPASALTFAEAMVTLRILPGEQTGWRPRVDLVPGGDGIAIVNQAQTVGRGRTRIQVTRAGYDGPILITGQIARGASAVWRAVPVPDPARYAAATFAEVLRERGITVGGGFRSVTDSMASPVTRRRTFAWALTGSRPLQVLAVHHSPPMLDILTVLNKHSHNLYAEQVLRTVGRVTRGAGTMEAGRASVEAMLDSAGSAESTLRMVDGSGLSVLNRVSAGTVVRLLSFMSTTPYFGEFVATLPEAGGVGLHRMFRTPAQGNLRAKTGTIDSVSALSGYVRAADGERLAFSIISNRVGSTWRAKRVEDAIGARLASFTRPIPTAPSATVPARILARADSIEESRKQVRSEEASRRRAAAQVATSATTGEAEEMARESARRESAPVAAATPPPSAAATLLDPASLPTSRLPLHAGAIASGTGPARPSGDDAPSTPSRTHTVSRGETLSGIARDYDVSLEELQTSNPKVDPRRLQLGQQLTIPGGSSKGQDTGPATSSAQPTSGAPADASPRFHTVRSGDTFDAIAKRYGVSITALRSANPGVRPRRLQVGQKVRIPTGG